MFNANSNFTINLSTLQPAPAQISLLDKGLTFIPAPHRIQPCKITECRDRNVRNLKLRDFFRNRNSDYDPKAFKNLFKPKSTWLPPEKGLTQEAKRASAKILSFTRKIITDHKETTPKGEFLTVPHLKNNLTSEEIAALRDLRNNKNIVIKPADKGGAIVSIITNNGHSLLQAGGLTTTNQPKILQGNTPAHRGSNLYRNKRGS